VLPSLYLQTIARAHWREFARRSRAVGRTQADLLMSMVRRNAESAFGSAHGFASMVSPKDFQARVPIGDWDTFSPYIDRIIGGEPNVLTDEAAPVLFNLTSGTAGRPKLIPVSPRTVRGNKLSHNLWMHRTVRDHPKFMSGKALPVVNRAVEGFTERTNIPYGSASGMVFRDAHPLTKLHYAYPYEVLEIDDVRSRWYTIMRCAVPERTTFIAGSTPNGIMKLLELADEAKEPLIRDVNDGTLSKDIDIGRRRRGIVERRLRPNPGRARELERAAERSGRLRPQEYWPDLKLISCWTGGTVGQFATQLREWCSPDTQLRDIGYVSSEAYVSIPISDSGSAGLLSIHTNVFEFVPEAEFGKPDARAYFADQIEIGTAYQILFTTPGGLYRYSINDVVEVEGFHDGAPLIRFLRKGRDVIDIQGEKVTGDQVVSAMRASLEASGCQCTHYLFVPAPDRACFHLHVEFTREPPPLVEQEKLLARFEKELRRVNFVFGEIRDEKVLGPTVLKVMQKGWLRAVTQRALDHGIRDTQFKPRVLDWKVPCANMFGHEVELGAPQLRPAVGAN
jgi:hypothetical protein